jgi:hypothetical protein
VMTVFPCKTSHRKFWRSAAVLAASGQSATAE